MNVNDNFGMPGSPTAGASSYVQCAKCGATNPSVSEFCRQCGDAGVTPVAASRKARSRTLILVALAASIITAIPLIGLHFVIVRQNASRYEAALQRSKTELSLNLGRAQISLNTAKPSLRDAEDERQRDLDKINLSVKLTSLQTESARLKADLQEADRRIKAAEDKYEDADLKLRNANGTLREVREELEACNDKQAKTMQRLTETESRLRSAEARRSRD